MIPPISILFFVIGTIFGSFLSAWVWRAKYGKSILVGRSMCPLCKKQLRVIDNIPIFGYLMNKGMCAQCKKPINISYLAVELWLAMAFVFIAWFHDFLPHQAPEMIRDMILVWVLTFIFVYDFKYKEVLDRMTLIPAALYFVTALYFDWNSIENMLWGAAIGGGFFLLQYVVSKGKWIGGGDIRIGVLMGVILGRSGILFALLLAYVLGALVGVYLLATQKKDLKSEIAFGTFLSIATMISMFYGNLVVGWYLLLLV